MIIKDRKLKRQRPGFTLVEITVVMAIISVLLLLTATAFISVRDQYIVDAKAEEILTTIREFQNNAISIKEENGVSPKVWALSFENNTKQYYPLKYNSDESDKALLAIDGLRNSYATSAGDITINLSSGLDTTLDNLVVAFSTPFGKAYLNEYEMHGANTSQLTTKCFWTNYPEKPTKEYYISEDCTDSASINYSAGQTAKITLNYKGKNAAISINTSGEAWIE